MPKGTLYGDAENFRIQKVLAAAKYGQSELNVVNKPLPQERFPFQVTPAFEDGQTVLFGAEAIALHVGGQAMQGQTREQLPEVVQWLQWSESQLLPAVMGFVLPSVSAMHVDKKELEEAKGELLALAHLLNTYLLSRTFLVGERLSLADLSVAFDLLPAYQHVLEGSLREDLTNLNRWFLTIVNQPEVHAVIGQVQLCTETQQFDAKKLKELTAKLEKGHEHGHDHGHKEKEGKKKGGGDGQKEKKKKGKGAEPAEEEELDASEEAAAQEPKQSDPLAALPKGTFNMDGFKRVYSNEDTLEKAIPFFWENFDSDNYSIWYSEYKYPEDLTLVFMSCNLINGMFQRLEKLKKNAFASVCLFGENNNSTISGVWVWRGHELVFPLSSDWQVDFESYSWKKLDAKDDKTKKLVKEYFAWEGDFDGKKFNQGKILK